MFRGQFNLRIPKTSCYSCATSRDAQNCNLKNDVINGNVFFAICNPTFEILSSIFACEEVRCMSKTCFSFFENFRKNVANFFLFFNFWVRFGFLIRPPVAYLGNRQGGHGPRGRTFPPWGRRSLTGEGDALRKKSLVFLSVIFHTIMLLYWLSGKERRVQECL